MHRLLFVGAPVSDCPHLFPVHASAQRVTSLDVSNNKLEVKGAKHVAEAIKVNVSSLQFIGAF